MGTDYGLGPIVSFRVESDTTLSLENWTEILSQRIDLSLFDLTLNEKELTGKINAQIFKENILDFYQLLKEMVGNYDSDHIEYYEKIYGDHLDDYQFWDTYLYVTGQNGKSIRIEANIALLFIEGKVIVEYFQTEPQIINWLFRHSGLKNKLAGCIVSTIVG